MPKQPKRGETRAQARENVATSTSPFWEFTTFASSLNDSAIFLRGLSSATASAMESKTTAIFPSSFDQIGIVLCCTWTHVTVEIMSCLGYVNMGLWFEGLIGLFFWVYFFWSIHPDLITNLFYLFNRKFHAECIWSLKYFILFLYHLRFVCSSFVIIPWVMRGKKNKLIICLRKNMLIHKVNNNNQ